jgi:hypothetical protein
MINEIQIDWSPIFDAMLTVFATIFSLLFAIYVPRVVKAFERMTGVQLDAAQEAQVVAAAETAKDLILVKVRHGVVSLAHATDPNHPLVVEHADSAVARVPAQGKRSAPVTQQAMREIIAGRVAAAGSCPPPQQPPSVVAVIEPSPTARQTQPSTS